MDPRHRDRVAFVRVCSGRFTKDMVVLNSRVGRPIRASRAYRFFGRERETISVAYAGDIIGLVNPGQFAIGDTLHSDAPVRFLGRAPVSGGALRPRPAAGPALQAVRRRAEAARGRRADAGVLRGGRPPRADRRRRRRPAARRDRQPAEDRVRRGRRRSSRRPTAPPDGSRMRGASRRCSRQWAARSRSPRIATIATSSSSDRSGSCSTSSASIRTCPCCRSLLPRTSPR